VVCHCCAIGTKIAPLGTKIALPHPQVAPSGNIRKINTHYYAQKED
jgi:hypothetical protein